jgi:uncharacterized oxidoreductase
MLNIVIDPAVFSDQSALGDEVKRYVAFIKSARPRNPGEPVMMPGDPEQNSMAERSADGISIDPETWRQIVDAGRSVGIDASVLEGIIS